MKFLKLVWYDLRHELLSKPVKWLIILALFTLLFFIFSLDVLHLWWFDSLVGKNLRNINVIGLSFGDVILTQMGGMLPIVFTTLEDSFVFPIKWLVPHILVLYYTLNYINEDLTHYGIQILTRTRSKRAWWFSKCVWNIITVILCFAVGILAIYFLSAITGKNLGFSLNPNVFFRVEKELLPTQSATNWEYFCALCAIPCVVCITVSLMQMVFALYVRPIFAYIASCVYYIAGAYYAHPLLISNYAMAVRNATIGFYNFYSKDGITICLLFSIVAIFWGTIRLERMDLMNIA